MLLALKKEQQQHKKNMSHNGKACKYSQRRKKLIWPPPPKKNLKKQQQSSKLHYKHIKEPRSYRKQANSPPPKKIPFLKWENNKRQKILNLIFILNLPNQSQTVALKKSNKHCRQTFHKMW